MNCRRPSGSFRMTTVPAKKGGRARTKFPLEGWDHRRRDHAGDRKKDRVLPEPQTLGRGTGIEWSAASYWNMDLGRRWLIGRAASQEDARRGVPEIGRASCRERV